MQDRS